MNYAHQVPSIKAITGDENFVWAVLANKRGLLKINQITGEHTLFNNTNSSIPDADIASIGIDLNGNLWLGTAESGVIKFDESTTTVYNTSNCLLPDNKIFSIAFDTLGNKWFGTSNGLACFSDTVWKVYSFRKSPLPSNVVRSIVIDKNNVKWIGTSGGGLARLENEEWTIFDTYNSKLSLNFILSLAIDKQNKLWIGTWGGGLQLFDGLIWQDFRKSNSLLPSDEIRALTVDNNNNIWIGTSSGITLYDGDDFRSLKKEKSLVTSSYINSLYVDYRNILWAGSLNGLTKFDGNKWEGINSASSGLPDNSSRVIAMDEQGNKWIGTQRGLAKFNGKNWKTFNTANSGIPSDRVTAIVLDENSYPWVGTYNQGLALFNGESWSVFNVSNSPLPSNQVSCLLYDKNKILWIGTADSGLVKKEGENWTIFKNTNSGLPENKVTSLSSDENNVLWIGTDGGGIARFDVSSWKVFNATNSGLKENVILSIAVGEDGMQWIGTQNGLYNFSGDEWHCFNRENSGITDNVIQSVKVDNEGNTWVGTKSGSLTKFDGDKWTTINSIKFQNQENPVYSIAIDPQGNKWIGTGKEGISAFKEEGVVTNNSIPMFRFKGMLKGLNQKSASSLSACSLNVYSTLLLSANSEKTTMPGIMAVHQKTKTFRGLSAKKFRLITDSLVLVSKETPNQNQLNRIYSGSFFSIEADVTGNGNYEKILSAKDVSFFATDSCPDFHTGFFTGKIINGKEEILNEFSALAKNNSFMAEMILNSRNNDDTYNFELKFYPSQKEIMVETKPITTAGVPVEFKESNTMLNFTSMAGKNNEGAASTVTFNKDTIVSAPVSNNIATVFSNYYWNISSTIDSFEVNICFNLDTNGFNTNSQDFLNIAYQSDPNSAWQLINSKPEIKNDKICFTVNHLSNWAIAISKPDDVEKDDFIFYNQFSKPDFYKSSFNGLELIELLKPGKRDTIAISQYEINPGGSIPQGITSMIKTFWEVKSTSKISRYIKFDLPKIFYSDTVGFDRVLYRLNATSAWSELPLTRSRVNNMDALYALSFLKGGQFTLGKSKNRKSIFSCNAPAMSASVNENINFSVTPTSGTAPFIYKWSGDENFLSENQSPRFLYPATGNYNYSVTVTDANGGVAVCGNKVTVSPMKTSALQALNPASILGKFTRKEEKYKSIKVDKKEGQWNKLFIKEEEGEKGKKRKKN